MKPSSLVAQMICVVLLALIIAQVLSLLILSSAYRAAISDVNQRARFQQVESLVYLLEDSPEQDYQAILSAARSKGVWFNVSDTSSIRADGMSRNERRIAQKLEEKLGLDYQDQARVKINKIRGHSLFFNVESKDDEGRSSAHRQLRKTCRDENDCGALKGGESQSNIPKNYIPKNYLSKNDEPKQEQGSYRHKRPLIKSPKLVSLKASVHLNNGLWLNLRASTPVVPPLAAKQTVVFLISSIFFVLIALAFMVRRITRPMRQLAGAAHRLGRGELVEELPETGPRDIRDTARAFNQMNCRLQRFVSDRTRMLAALSHDLRTPITTMRLRIELMSDSADRDHLLATLDEMQQMSEATLAFIRQSSDNEPTRKVDLSAMLASVCDDQLELGHDVQFIEAEAIVISCRLVSLKRALRNLVENAVNYGDQAKVSVQVSGNSGNNVVVKIQDSGPGIPSDQLQKVFEPFFRLESSRNRHTGGVGLGMAIARNIIRNHGGEIYLSNNSTGLEVTVVIPVD